MLYELMLYAVHRVTLTVAPSLSPPTFPPLFARFLT